MMINEQNLPAWDVLDACTYRLFGVGHLSGRNVFELPNGDSTVMTAGLSTPDGRESLMAITLLSDGIREIEVHAGTETHDPSCRIWRIRCHKPAEDPAITVTRLCRGRKIADVGVQGELYTYELRTLASIANQLAGTGSGYDVQNIIKMTSREDPRFPPSRNGIFLRTVLKQTHLFHSDSVRRYVEWAKEQLMG